MIELEIYRGESTRLNDLPITDGNLIITTDDGKMYADVGTERILIGGADLNLANGTAEKSLIQTSEKTDTAIKLNFADVPNVGSLTDADGQPIAREYNRYDESNVTTAAFGTSVAKGKRAFAAGSSNVAAGKYSIALGADNYVAQDAGVGLGYANYSNGFAAIATGQSTQALADGAHTEGMGTTASGKYAHAEGCDTEATQENAHAEGYGSKATAVTAHAEGNITVASGPSAHAEGNETEAKHSFSHTSGDHTRSSKNAQTVVGAYNADNSSAMFIVGRGTSEGNRLNGFESLDDGRAVIGADPINPMDVATKQYVDTANDQKLKSKITIYNNVKPSTFDWWGAINQALGNTEVDDSNMQTGCFQLNLADNCYFTGFDNDWVYDKNKLNSALVNFTVVYFMDGNHEMTLTINWNGTTYTSDNFSSYWDAEKGFAFTDIPDNIPFTKWAAATESNTVIYNMGVWPDGMITMGGSLSSLPFDYTEFLRNLDDFNKRVCLYFERIPDNAASNHMPCLFECTHHVDTAANDNYLGTPGNYTISFSGISGKQRYELKFQIFKNSDSYYIEPSYKTLAELTDIPEAVTPIPTSTITALFT